MRRSQEDGGLQAPAHQPQGKGKQQYYLLLLGRGGWLAASDIQAGPVHHGARQTPDGQTPCGITVFPTCPGQPHFRNSVKREMPPEANTPKGYVSNLLHDAVEPSHTLE